MYRFVSLALLPIRYENGRHEIGTSYRPLFVFTLFTCTCYEDYMRTNAKNAIVKAWMGP